MVHPPGYRLSDQGFMNVAAGFRDHQTRFHGRTEAARALVERVEHPADRICDAADLAAMAVITQTILNLDEALTKE